VSYLVIDLATILHISLDDIGIRFVLLTFRRITFFLINFVAKSIGLSNVNHFTFLAFLGLGLGTIFNFGGTFG